MCECSAHNGFLLAKGLEEAAQRRASLAALDAMGPNMYLDKVGSVSGLELERDSYRYTSDTFLDRQAERFHNGS